MQSISEAENVYRIVTLVVPPGISGVTIQGYKLELSPAPELGEGVNTCQVPMNLVQELKSHRLMTKVEWAALMEKQQLRARALPRRPLLRREYA